MIKEEAIEIMKHEPDWFEFEHCGYKCVISRMTPNGGNLNGYVGIPKEHILFGKDFNEKIYTNKEPIYRDNPMDMLLIASDPDKEENCYRLGSLMEVHGGVTYSRGSLDKRVDQLGLWWFGFDTGHAGDLRPFDMSYEELVASMPKGNPMRELLINVHALKDEVCKGAPTEEIYRDFNYVMKETETLAENLKYYE